MNNNPKGTKNPKKPLIFYYAVMLLVLMMLNWLLFPSLLQRPDCIKSATRTWTPLWT